MPLIPFPVEEFGGLNLLVDSTEVGMSGAVDMLNAETVRVLGRLATRAGLSRLVTGTATYHKIGGTSAFSMVACRNTGSVLQLDVVSTFASTVTAAGTTWGSSSTRVTSIQPILVSGVSRGVVASRSGSSNESLRLDDGSAPGVGSPRYIALTPWDDRGVQAHFTSAGGTPSGANGTTSTVFFSNPGDFTTWGANNWIELMPDDGDPITGITVWREFLFVIKRRQMFVFYGTSTLSDGSPVFNYRAVNLPARARVTTNGGGENMIAGSDGVYLLLGDGVYRTTGGVPVLVSRPVSSVFDRTGPTSMLFPASGDWNIGYAANRVYLTYTVSGTFRTLVFDTVTGTWLLWDLSAGQSAQPTNVIDWVDANGTPTTYVASGGRVYSIDPTVTSDDGTAIAWSYTTGYSSAGGYYRQRIVSSGERKNHFKVDLLGSGTITHQVLTLNGRPNDVADPGGSVTLGTSPALARGSRRRGARGTHFAHKLSGSGPAVVSGLTYWLQGIEQDT
jgi:hypothetical protein